MLDFLPTLVFKDESGCNLDSQYQPFDAQCKVFCRHQLTCLCARAQAPRDSDRDAHVVCPGKILTPAECHAFTLASSTVRSLATMRWAQRRALPSGLEELSSPPDKAMNWPAGPRSTLDTKTNSTCCGTGTGSSICSMRGLSPRPMAHRTIALTTELMEPCCRGLHMVTLAKRLMLCVCRGSPSAGARAGMPLIFIRPKGAPNRHDDAGRYLSTCQH